MTAKTSQTKTAPKTRKAKPATKAKPASKPKSKKLPRVTVSDRIITLLRRANGATIEEVIAECPMKPATARAAISVQTRKRGLKAEYDKATKRYRTV